MVDQVNAIQRLVLSAEDLRTMRPDWPHALIEDYLNILDDILRVAGGIDSSDEQIQQLFAESNLKRIVPRETQDADPQVQNGRVVRQVIDTLVVGEVTAEQINYPLSQVNTNTPAGATAYALEIKDGNGATIGYAPVYGSLW